MDDAWAEVELFRWQYGELPGSEDERKLDVPDALEAMATAISSGKATSSFNVGQVLSAVARWFRAGRSENADQKIRIAELEQERDHARKLTIRDDAGQVVTQGAFNALISQRGRLTKSLEVARSHAHVVAEKRDALERYIAEYLLPGAKRANAADKSHVWEILSFDEWAAAQS
jgi:hypothetical protein